MPKLTDSCFVVPLSTLAKAKGVELDENSKLFAIKLVTLSRIDKDKWDATIEVPVSVLTGEEPGFISDEKAQEVFDEFYS